MKVLLDTHALLWWVLGNPRLSTTAAAVLSDTGTAIFVSAVSGHEIATKYRLGKLLVPARLAEHLEELAAENGWQELPLTIAHAQLAGLLPGQPQGPIRLDAGGAGVGRRHAARDQRSRVCGVRSAGDLVG